MLIEESLLGWKEYEMEVVRDRHDNCIIICSIENVDPMGVHTGDSITVAPALTLTDKEYQIMRSASIAVLREIGVETGGSNVQFAVNPKDGRLIVIEMNPRVSRSSALASKATGFPIARVAAKLAVGYTLDELTNEITGATPASFEPSIDYVVTKIPRFAFEKFKGAEPLLSTAMKSVGEVMAIGRNFKESMQKALRGLETGLDGFNEIEELAGAGRDQITAALSRATPDRLLIAAQALREGFGVDDINAITHYDPWFLRQIAEIIEAEAGVIADGLPNDAAGLRRLKAMGFSDKRLATLAVRSVHLAGGLGNTLATRSGLLHDVVTAMAGASTEQDVCELRHRLGVFPVFKRIDSCAAEFEAITPYMYSTYEGPLFGEPEDEAAPSDRRKIVILGGGPNRIGQGIEFDYCCCHACFALEEAGYETIMINCNPETVSTDYDTSDRLYFEPLTAEDVLEILRVEQQAGELVGVIVQFGGQTPLKLAQALEDAGIPILGTSPDAIDLAEDRERFSALVERLGLKQPLNGMARSRDEAVAVAQRIGFPVLIRPSYVLGGRAMEIVDSFAQLDDYIATAVKVSGDSPVLIDQYLRDAIECDVDALCDGEVVVVAGVMQHIEEAGIHSGDSACTLPPYSLPQPIIAEMERQAELLALALGVKGLMNIQFAVQAGEVLPDRGQSARFAHRALRRQGDRPAGGQDRGAGDGGRKAVRLPAVPPRSALYGGQGSGVPVRAFPRRRSGAEPGDEVHRRSHGHRCRFRHRLWQGAAWGRDRLAAGRGGLRLGQGQRQEGDPAGGAAIGRAGLHHHRHRRHPEISGRCRGARGADQQGCRGRPHIVDRIVDGDVAFIINTTEGWQSLKDSQSIRASALTSKVPYFTTAAASVAATAAIAALRRAKLEVRSLQDYYS